KLACRVYESVQRREGDRRSVSRWLKKKSKTLLSASRRVEQKALLHAGLRGADFILCGHTHYHLPNPDTTGQTAEYINTGCWTDLPSTLTTIGPDGLRKHLYY